MDLHRINWFMHIHIVTEYLKCDINLKEEEITWTQYIIPILISHKSLLIQLVKLRCFFICIQTEAIVKYNDSGAPVKRMRKKVTVQHAENIASRSFWSVHSCLIKDLGSFVDNVNNIRPEYVQSFNFENKLMPCTWIVVRIDGCHFHRSSYIRTFLFYFVFCVQSIFETIKSATCYS